MLTIFKANYTGVTLKLIIYSWLIFLAAPGGAAVRKILMMYPMP
jgi:hypothetical protein